MGKLTWDKLAVVKRLEKYKKVRGLRETYDYSAALGESPPHRRPTKRHEPDEIIKEICKKNRWGALELAKIVREVKSWPEGSVLNVLEPGDHPAGAIRAEDVFGNVKQWSKLRAEITDLVLRGESLKEHKRRLQLKYHLYPEGINKPGLKQEGRNVLVKDVWRDIEEDYKRYSPLERKAILDWRIRMDEADKKGEGDSPSPKRPTARVR